MWACGSNSSRFGCSNALSSGLADTARPQRVGRQLTHEGQGTVRPPVPRAHPALNACRRRSPEAGNCRCLLSESCREPSRWGRRVSAACLDASEPDAPGEDDSSPFGPLPPDPRVTSDGTGLSNASGRLATWSYGRSGVFIYNFIGKFA